MQITTTHTKPKSFSFSYSKLKNFASCPHRYYKVDVLREIKEAESEQLKWGNQVHDALAKRVGNKSPLPKGMEQFEDLATRVENVPGQVMVEQKLAIKADFGPTAWFDKQAWFRAIADVLIVNGDVALAIDYKLGKILEDSQQLALLSACVFAHYPDVHAIRTEFWWLKDDAVSRADFKRTDMPAVWNNVLPRVKELQHAHETLTFPPRPGGLCRSWCPVTSCLHHGK